LQALTGAAEQIRGRTVKVCAPPAKSRGGIMTVNSKGYVQCPRCGKPTKVKVLPETVLQKFPLFCPWCKQETVIDRINS
jgi:hypothetical protein